MDKKQIDFRYFVLVLVLLLVIPTAYYFFYALPKHDQELLDLEREKFEAEQEAKTEELETEQAVLDAQVAAEQEEQNRENCLVKADEDFQAATEAVFQSVKDLGCADSNGVVYFGECYDAFMGQTWATMDEYEAVRASCY